MGEEGSQLQPSPLGLRTHTMDLLVGTSSLSGQFPHGVPSFSLIASELYHAISGKTTVVAAVKKFQSLTPPASALCQALCGILGM